MAISFDHVPQDVRLGLFVAELDPSQAGRFSQKQRALVFGHPLTATDLNVPKQMISVDAAKEVYGVGSQLVRMLETFRANNSYDEIWMVAVAEPSAGVAATGSIVVDSAATASGTLFLYIAGQRLQVAVTAGDTAAAIAASINAAINAHTDLPVTSSVTTATLTLTCRWKGMTGNDIDMRLNYRGLLGGEETPAGVALSFTAFAGGTGAPDLSVALANLNDEPFETIIHPWTDDASMDEFDLEWGMTDGSRWAWDRRLYGHVWTARNGTTAELGTFGNNRNGPTQTVWGYYGSPTPPWERAVAFAAQAHRALLNDPARPLRTLPLVGVLAPLPEDRFSFAQKNTLLYDGISVANERDDGTIEIGQAITTYQKNASNIEDDAMLKVNTMATSSYVMRALEHQVTSRFARHKLANDGTRFGPGQKIVTPNTIRAFLVAQYAELETLGIVENAKAFNEHLIVERNVGNPNRLDVLYTPDYVNQLDVFAVVNQFRLQYPTDQPTQVLSA